MGWGERSCSSNTCRAEGPAEGIQPAFTKCSPGVPGWDATPEGLRSILRGLRKEKMTPALFLRGVPFPLSHYVQKEALGGFSFKGKLREAPKEKG